LKPEDLISLSLDAMLGDTLYSRKILRKFDCMVPDEPPEEEIEWAKALITNRIEDLNLSPTEEELYTLMKLRMKV
jgi:hypothetical protein